MKKTLFLLMAVLCVSCTNNKEEKDLHFGPGPEDKAESVNDDEQCTE